MLMQLKLVYTYDNTSEIKELNHIVLSYSYYIIMEQGGYLAIRNTESSTFAVIISASLTTVF